ncbi:MULTISPECIES: MarR family winged helix-turn-helix transcriptional regulator [Lysinibacillus]|uniref:MarR family transcriptional regulator n=1 Tax=Lysinibacillus pakistanensis TaxID=759811 RepID=A0AAX3WQM2_9BACI|nr:MULTISPECIES: MarR family transcriptional regulator [Lysinibacillus]MDM5233863.1 MarR family transcriptional regulator [Lysinibacillus pakistanensis]WHY44476.1 MarR family transcriptional regulator [Lysinibacillus pakistanensis]WHY49484.1 MarR family transcriptional regulator [Lysinibacillus pakistanensis]
MRLEDNNIVSDIRKFNRFYTKLLNLLDSHVLNTDYSFTEARIILEIGFMEQCIANNLVEKLDIDRSYMSRIIAKLGRDGVIRKKASTADSRTSLISLTPKGIDLFKQLNKKSDEQIVKLFHGLSQKEIKEVHSSMMLIQQKLDKLGDLNDTF